MQEMEALSILHRDLATRNVLVHSIDAQDQSRIWIKITDFGLARHGKEAWSDDGEVPWRWTAPEALESHYWCTASDVWSFGVTLWEIFSNALIPFCEISDDEELQRRVFGKERLRLAPPDHAPTSVYEIMLLCWRHHHSDRPTFSQLLLMLHEASDAHCIHGGLFVI